MRGATFLLVVATIVVVYAVAMPTFVVSQQGWFPVPVIDAPRIQELGKWAVMEHDKKTSDKVKFNRVVSGQEKEDPQLGIKYHFIVDALDGNGRDRKYEVVLADQAWIEHQILISFSPAR